MSASPFTAAHKVVIDCALFLAAQIMDDDRTPLVIDQLARALPLAHATGTPAVDHLMLACQSALSARRDLARGVADASLTHAAADMALHHAATNFIWSRLGQSAGALVDTQPQELAHG